MRNQMIRGMNGYVLSPFGTYGDVSMSDPAYGWGGAGATSTPAATSNTGTDIGTVLGSIGKGILSVFAAPAQTPTATSLAQQQAMYAQQQAMLNAQGSSNMPLYLAGGAALLLGGFLLLKK